jgi:hypothetical protein
VIRVWDKEYDCWADYFPDEGEFGGLLTRGGRVFILPQRFYLEPVGFDWDGTIKPIAELS